MSVEIIIALGSGIQVYEKIGRLSRQWNRNIRRKKYGVTLEYIHQCDIHMYVGIVFQYKY